MRVLAIASGVSSNSAAICCALLRKCRALLQRE
jgi:hypothetical protein